jgi:5-methylcytosine-specific restriction endonuclease McrA
VLARDRYVCQLCGAPATEVDHVVRVADGGSDHPDNLRAICGRCQRSPAA